MPGASKIFKGYRALGLTSNHVPLSVRHHEKTQRKLCYYMCWNGFPYIQCEATSYISHVKAPFSMEIVYIIY